MSRSIRKAQEVPSAIPVSYEVRTVLRDPAPEIPGLNRRLDEELNRWFERQLMAAFLGGNDHGIS